LHRFVAPCGNSRLAFIMKRSFQSLSPQEALHVAVFIEERNSEIYHHFAEMFVSFQDFASLEIAGVLWDMAVEERHHSFLLQERYTAKYGLASCALTETDILEIIELPQLDDREIFDSNAAAATAHFRALKVALSAENQARDFYAELAQNTGDPELRALYVELSSFEADHVEFLERRLSNSTPRG
jgi:rubrerythrin